MYNIMKDCFDSVVTKKIGFEAQLANITHDWHEVEEVAIGLEISGFSQKIFEFAKTFIDILLECAETEFE